jgi:uncharacterized protein (TIGR02996 family)
VNTWDGDDYIDGPNGPQALEHGELDPELVRRIIADPGDESAWLAYSADLADHGRDAEALIVRVLWGALRDSLVTCRSFDAVMADVRRNRTLLHALAVQRGTDPATGRTRLTKSPLILFGLALAVLLAYIAIIFVPEVLGGK